jgi:hypothetical protein
MFWLLLLINTVAGINCSQLGSSASFYDISPLFANNHNITLYSEDHEQISFDRTELVMNICKPIGKLENIDQHDQCPETSFACKYITNWKRSIPRVISAKPIGKDFTLLGDHVDIKGVFLKLTDDIISINIAITCAVGEKNITSTLRKYSTTQIDLSWSHECGCLQQRTQEEKSGSFLWSLSSFIFWSVVSIYLFGVGLNFFLGERTPRGLLHVRLDILKEFSLDMVSRIRGRNQYVSL